MEDSFISRELGNLFLCFYEKLKYDVLCILPFQDSDSLAEMSFSTESEESSQNLVSYILYVAFIYNKSKQSHNFL